MTDRQIQRWRYKKRDGVSRWAKGWKADRNGEGVSGRHIVRERGRDKGERT